MVGVDAFKADVADLAHPVRNAVCDFKAALRPSSLAKAQRALDVAVVVGLAPHTALSPAPTRSVWLSMRERETFAESE